MSIAEATGTPSLVDTTGLDPHRAGGVDHVHDHDTEHTHGAAGHVHTEAKPPTTPSRAVLIDVGEKRGALILNARSNLEGIEVNPSGV